jgi:GTP cyclohydrolase I
MIRVVTMAEVREMAGEISLTVPVKTPLKLYGVPNGGIPAVYEVAKLIPQKTEVVFDWTEADVIIDDIRDSGRTAERYPGKPFRVLFDKQTEMWRGSWLIMPWEKDVTRSAEDIVVRLLEFVGEDPNREGLKETPRRVITAWQEWTSGYAGDPEQILSTTFNDHHGYDEFVIVNNVPVISKCEHHLADIIGIAHVGYIPGNGRIVGISKLARLVEVFARRLTVQERMTVQIADALVEHLQPKGVGVVIRAAHACMSTRGVRVHNSVTTTSAMRGALLDKPAARKEFFDLCAMAERSNQ